MELVIDLVPHIQFSEHKSHQWTCSCSDVQRQ